MTRRMPFNVMRHADWDVAPRHPEMIASALVSAGMTAGATSTVILSNVIYYAASTAITSYAMNALSEQQMSAAKNQGSLLNFRGAAEPHEYVYGRVRKGGVITYMSSSGAKNKYLHMIITLAGEPVESIDDVYINDQIVTINGSGFVTSDPWASKIRIKKYTGTQTAVDSDLQSETSGTAGYVGANFIGYGIAYLYVRLEYDGEIFSGGVPTITAVVSGKKVKNTSNVDQTYPASANAALVIRDYIRSAYGLDDTSVDDTYFAAAASDCNDNIPLAAGGTQKRYTIDGVVRSDVPIGQTLQDLVRSCNGALFYGGGSWKLKVGVHSASVKSFTLDNLRSGISLPTKASRRDNYNSITGKFVHADADYIEADFPAITSSAFLSEDNNIANPLDVSFPFLTDSSRAQRVAKQMLFRSREQMTFTADFDLTALGVEVGDIVDLTISEYGWTNKEFEVGSWSLTRGDSGAIRIAMTLRETSSAAFDWDAEESELLANNTNLPAINEVPEIGVTLSQEYRAVNQNVTNAMVIYVTSSSFEQIDFVRIRYKKTSDTNYKNLGQGRLPSGAQDVARFEVNDIEVPQIDGAAINYTVKVTPVNAFGFSGAEVTNTINMTADSTPPAAPTNFDHLLSGGTIFLHWDAVADLDLSHYSLWYSSNTSASFGDASVQRVIAKIARPATSVTYPALAGKFFISAIDKTGNESTTADSLVVSASELPQLGTSVTHTESTTFVGSKTNLTASGGALYMTSYSSAGSTGTYRFDHSGAGYFDVGTSRTVRLSYDITQTRKHALASGGSINWDSLPGNWDTWPDNWDTWTDETADFADFSVQVQARASADASTWGTWTDASGELVGRYIQFRAIFSNTNANVTPSVTLLTATVEY